MEKIESKTGTIHQSDEKIFHFLTDFNHIKPFAEDKVSEWTSTEDTCSFTVQGMAKIGMKMTEKEPFKLIKITEHGSSALKFTIWIQLKQVEPQMTKIKITLHPQVDKMMGMMLKKPLQNFADKLVDALEHFAF